MTAAAVSVPPSAPCAPLPGLLRAALPLVLAAPFVLAAQGGGVWVLAQLLSRQAAPVAAPANGPAASDAPAAPTVSNAPTAPTAPADPGAIAKTPPASAGHEPSPVPAAGPAVAAAHVPTPAPSPVSHADPATDEAPAVPPSAPSAPSAPAVAAVAAVLPLPLPLPVPVLALPAGLVAVEAPPRPVAPAVPAVASVPAVAPPLAAELPAPATVTPASPAPVDASATTVPAAEASEAPAAPAVIAGPRSEAAADGRPATLAAADAAPAPIAAAAAPTVLLGPDWVMAQPRGNQTLQIIGGTALDAIRQYARSHDFGGLPVAYLQTERDGRPWYFLLAGSFGSAREAATAARTLKTAQPGLQPWMRRFGAVQALAVQP